MWKLEKSTTKYVNLSFTYILFSILIIPIVSNIFIDSSWDLLFFRGVYGVLYALIIYIIVWISVPLLVFFIRNLKNNLGISMSFFIWVLAIMLIILLLIKLDPNLIVDKEDIAVLTTYCTIPLFLWFLVYLKEF